MRLEPPARGSVIRYAYLWADEQRRGHEEGRKDRPALALALVVVDSEGTAEVLVVPISHVPPARESDAVVLPAGVKKRFAPAGFFAASMPPAQERREDTPRRCRHQKETRGAVCAGSCAVNVCFGLASG